MNPGQESTSYIQGGGYGAGGFGGIAPFGLFGLLGLNNGLGYGNGAGAAATDAAIGQRITDLQIAGVNTNINSAEANLTSATLQQTNNLGGLILNSGNGVTNTVRTAADVLASQMGGVKDTVQNLGYENAILTLNASNGINSNITDLGYQGQAQTCQLDRSISDAKTEIIANQNAIAMQNLHDELTETKMNYALDQRGLLTATGPNMAVVQPNPCANRDITIINENVNAIGSKVDQTVTALNQMAGIVSQLQASATK